jgi:hypothetical protein
VTCTSAPPLARCNMTKAVEGLAGGPQVAGKRFIDIDEYAHLCRIRLEHAVQVREPLVLISQIQRSGGTLLSQLFDSHPECHAHPHELQIGYPKKTRWPPLNLDAPETWFPMLFERTAGKQLERGYHKPPGKDRFPFLFLPKLQRSIFEECIASRPIHKERDVLDCYMTSYFNAWVDNQNLHAGSKAVVTGFAPSLSMDMANVERFFAAYPDGKLISIIREPTAWYASARKHHPHYGILDEAVGLWCRSTSAAMEAHDRFRDRVLILRYEQLVLQTEATMRRVAGALGITMSPTLLSPTFNGRPIRANSADPVARHGILPERTYAYRDQLDAETIARIADLTGDLYGRAAALALERV